MDLLDLKIDKCKRLNGIGISKGIAIGKCTFINKHTRLIEKKNVLDIEHELKRFENSINHSKLKIEKLQEQTLESLDKNLSEIFSAHLMILEDPELLENTVSLIQNEKVNAEWALEKVANVFIESLSKVNNKYIQGRVADIKEVSEQVLDYLTGAEEIKTENLNSIIILEELNAGDISGINRDNIKGIIVQSGEETSHAAILARNIGIPTVFSVKEIFNFASADVEVALDGETGEVFIDPDQNVINIFHNKRIEFSKKINELNLYKNLKSKTLDGHFVQVGANIGLMTDLESAVNCGAEGVGLYRTEFMASDSLGLPDENIQFENYKRILTQMSSHLVVIRTFDIGSDKPVKNFSINQEPNPALGMRGIRLCLKERNAFLIQISALLRASVFGNLAIMFPMVSSLDEVLILKEIVQEMKLNLEAQGISVSKKIQIGIMIEVPAAAMITDVLAKHVDFFSIGTNDLTQYTCATDRLNEHTRVFYEPFHPGVLKLIAMTIENAHKNGIWAGMCGSIAAKKEMVPFLLGVGLDEFSVDSNSILSLRSRIAQLTMSDCKALAKQALNCETASAVKALMSNSLQ